MTGSKSFQLRSGGKLDIDKHETKCYWKITKSRQALRSPCIVAGCSKILLKRVMESIVERLYNEYRNSAFCVDC